MGFQYLILFLGLLLMAVFTISDFLPGVFFVGLLTIYFIVRIAKKKAKAYNDAVEAVSKEAHPDLYNIIKEKTKDIK